MHPLSLCTWTTSTSYKFLFLEGIFILCWLIFNICFSVPTQVEAGAQAKTFTFNVTFEPEASQEDVFENCGVKRLVEMALDGWVI